MKTTSRVIPVVILSVLLPGCDDWLTTEPQTILTDEQVWGDPGLVTSVLADYYDRIPTYQSLDNANWPQLTAFDEALYSGVPRGWGAGFSTLQNYAYDRWGAWQGPYSLIRDIHVAMDGVENGSLSEDQKTKFLAELRFLRAFTYFELVKRYGGVPLITSQQLYDFSGDISPLQHPRAPEADVYDFIGSEMDAIADQLGNTASQTRANRSAALALKSRAMLYAGSLARYNSELPSPIALPGGVVGIPASRAEEYFTESLDASRELISSGARSLVQGPVPGDAFHQVFVNKGNSEVILAKDYLSWLGQGPLLHVACLSPLAARDCLSGLGRCGCLPDAEPGGELRLPRWLSRAIARSGERDRRRPGQLDLLRPDW
jgi:hypothetical protein